MEYPLSELGYFTEDECKTIIKKLDGKTYMKFHISYSNYAGNCILVIKTDYKESPEEIKNFFMWLALAELAKADE